MLLSAGSEVLSFGLPGGTRLRQEARWQKGETAYREARQDLEPCFIPGRVATTHPRLPAIFSHRKAVSWKLHQISEDSVRRECDSAGRAVQGGRGVAAAAVTVGVE